MNRTGVESRLSLFPELVSLEMSGSNPKYKSSRDRTRSSYMTRVVADGQLMQRGIYTIGLMGNDVVALLEHLGVVQAHVIGHSMGGRIGLSTALNFPGKVKSLIIAAGGS